MRNLGAGSGGAIHWLMQRVSGLAIVILVGFHLIVAHYTVPSEGLSYKWVATRMADPLWKLYYLFLLILCVYHGLNGIWMIFQDYVHKDGLRIGLFGGLAILGMLMISLGALTIIPFPSRQ